MVQFRVWGHFLNSDGYFLGYSQTECQLRLKPLTLRSGITLRAPTTSSQSYVPPLPVENVQCDLPLKKKATNVAPPVIEARVQH